jgi:hypothetical protein
MLKTNSAKLVKIIAIIHTNEIRDPNKNSGVRPCSLQGCINLWHNPIILYKYSGLNYIKI